MPSNLLEADAKIGRITESTKNLPIFSAGRSLRVAGGTSGFLLKFSGNDDGSVQFVKEPLLVRKNGKILGDFDVLFIQHQQFNVLRVTFAT